MLENQTYRHIADCQNRIKYCRIRFESLRRLGLATEIAEAELRRETEALTHLEHHRNVFEYTLRMCGLLAGEVVDHQ